MKKILFIEEELAIQKSLGDILKQEGYKVITALDGEIGLKMAQTEKPDLILLDLILPKLLGLEVLKKLKESKETEDISVIILTNVENAEDINKAIELGITTYLVKANYSLIDLFQKIKKILNN